MTPPKPNRGWGSILYPYCIETIFQAEANGVEDTVFVSLTLQEAAVLGSALIPFGRLFPEAQKLTAALAEKLHAVGTAQEFWPADKE